MVIVYLNIALLVNSEGIVDSKSAFILDDTADKRTGGAKLKIKVLVSNIEFLFECRLNDLRKIYIIFFS